MPTERYDQDCLQPTKFTAAPPNGHQLEGKQMAVYSEMEYYSAMKRNAFLTGKTTETHLKNITLSDKSHTHKEHILKESLYLKF